MGMWEDLLATRLVAEMKLEFVTLLSKTLAAEWCVSLALFIKDEITLSDKYYGKLGLAFCKRYDASLDRWLPRPWFTCPVTGKTVNIPQPLVSRYRWFPRWRSYVEHFGLKLSFNGKVAERSLLATARLLIDRDRTLLTTPIPQQPWLLTLGLDGTAISGKRAFTHVALSLGAMLVQQP
eukprot:3926421-Pleurochrysis_carterae.AAC.4